VPDTDRKLTDRSAITVLVLAASLLANLLLLTQIFVMRPEFLSELRAVNRRLANIEIRLGIDGQPEQHKQGNRTSWQPEVSR